jgi:ferritin
MAINEKVSKLLNDQINSEMTAGYIYLDMAAYFERMELPGFASWFKAHSKEESDHAMRIFDFLAMRSNQIKLEGIDKPIYDYSSPEAALEIAVAMEKDVTNAIHNLFEVAHEVKEYGTQNMLHWFLDEQIKEEHLFGHILDQVKAAGDNRWHMLQLDKQMAAGGVDQ